jgi:hypothetical protein
MPTYQPNIPTGSVDLDEDYLNLLGNFQQLNIAYGVDHVPFSDTSGTFPAGITGIHTNIHLNPFSTKATNPPNNQPVVAPSATAGFGQIFSSQINDGISTDTALYFLTGAGLLQQLTRNFSPVVATTGRTFLAGGLIIQWGTISAVATSLTAVTFVALGAIAFPNNCFFVQTNINAGSTSNPIVLNISALTKTGFSYYNTSSSSSRTFYWFALGN